MNGSVRRRWLALGTAIALALGLWLVLGAIGGPGDAAGPAASRAAPPPVSAPGGAPPPAAQPDGPPPDPEDEDLPEPVRRYLRSHAYPATSGRLHDDAVDLLEPGRRWERPKLVPDTLGEDPPVRFLFTADAYYYDSDETVEARLEVERGDLPADVEILAASAQPEARGGASGDPIPLEFRPRGGALVAELRLASHLPEHFGPVLLRVRFRYDEGRSHEDGIRIFVTPETRIPAAFTGHFQDYVRDGSLVVEVGVDAFREGFYRLDANAYDPEGRPVAFASFKGMLDEGESMVRLEFFGKAFHEAGLDGPYTIDQIRGYRFLDGQYPDREPMKGYPGSWRTNRYAIGEFSDADYDSEHKRRMVELMLEDVKAGRSLDVPDLAVESGDAPPKPASLVQDVVGEVDSPADPSPSPREADAAAEASPSHRERRGPRSPGR